MLILPGAPNLSPHQQPTESPKQAKVQGIYIRKFQTQMDGMDAD
jgi:hypothetical protein